MAQQVGHRLRELRVAKNLSIRTLATHAGFSASFISQVERGQASPSIDSLERIANALGVTLGDIFVTKIDPCPAVVGARERPSLSSSWSRARVEALGPVAAGQKLASIMVTFDPGGRSGTRLQRHPHDEFVIVFEGQILLKLRETEHYLERGDAVTIPAGLEHGWSNVSLEPAQVVMVTSRSAADAFVTRSE